MRALHVTLLQNQNSFIFFVYIFIHISANMSLFGLKFSQMILHTETSKTDVPLILSLWSFAQANTLTPVPLKRNSLETSWKTDKESLVSPGQGSCTQVCGGNGCSCVTVALNWLITLHILLIWQHLIIFCSHTWRILSWEAVSDRWWGHICSRGLLILRVRIQALQHRWK